MIFEAITPHFENFWSIVAGKISGFLLYGLPNVKGGGGRLGGRVEDVFKLG